MKCGIEGCPDAPNYGKLIYSIKCKWCWMIKVNKEDSDYWDQKEDEMNNAPEDYCICGDDENNPNCEWCF